jgi:hypothetical protein
VTKKDFRKSYLSNLNPSTQGEEEEEESNEKNTRKANQC